MAATSADIWKQRDKKIGKEMARVYLAKDAPGISFSGIYSGPPSTKF